MAIDIELEISGDIGEKPRRIDSHTEQLILAEYAKKAKDKKLKETIERNHARQTYLHLLFFSLSVIIVLLIYKNGYWEVIKDFFISMSQ
jgi:hypothetical protein